MIKIEIYYDIFSRATGRVTEIHQFDISFEKVTVLLVTKYVIYSKALQLFCGAFFWCFEFERVLLIFS